MFLMNVILLFGAFRAVTDDEDDDEDDEDEDDDEDDDV